VLTLGWRVGGKLVSAPPPFPYYAERCHVSATANSIFPASSQNTRWSDHTLQLAASSSDRLWAEGEMARGSEKKTDTFLSLVSVFTFISHTIPPPFYPVLARGSPFYTLFIA